LQQSTHARAPSRRQTPRTEAWCGQIANARAFAESKGWTVDDDHIYADDGISGAEVKKLVSKQRMLKLIQSGAAPF
jgi:hypothetical protein